MPLLACAAVPSTFTIWYTWYMIHCDCRYGAAVLRQTTTCLLPHTGIFTTYCCTWYTWYQVPVYDKDGRTQYPAMFSVLVDDFRTRNLLFGNWHVAWHVFHFLIGFPSTSHFLHYFIHGMTLAALLLYHMSICTHGLDEIR